MNTLAAKKLSASKMSIPTLPAIVQRISELMLDPAVGTAEIGALVAEDPPLAAKVLKIANSSYYGLREPCVSTEKASAVLGVRVLRNVVTQAAVIKQFDHLKNRGFDLDELWRHSVLVAQLARHLAQRSTRRFAISPDEFYTCGLLHDLGKVVLLENMTLNFLDAVTRSKADKLPMHVCEQRALDFNHADVGAMVAVQWGLPPSIANAIQYHHGPREEVQRDPAVALIANSNLIVERAAGGNLSGAAGVLDGPTAQFLGIALEHVDGVVEFVSQALATQVEV